MKALNRRTLLRGMLAGGLTAAVPLPLLEAMLNESGTALAQSATVLPPLYVTWFFGNGVLPALWKPAKTGTGANWELSAQLKPLAGVKSHLTVISGLEGKLVVAGVEHPSGSAAATTGAPLNGNAVRSASIDQIVADVISAGAPFRSLEVGVTPATPNGNQDSLHTVSHRGPSAMNSPVYDPKAVFNRLFVEGAAPSGGSAQDQAAKLAKVRKSVLDSTPGRRRQASRGSASRGDPRDRASSRYDVEHRLVAGGLRQRHGSHGGQRRSQ
jgi:hypothetical protein